MWSFKQQWSSVTSSGAQTAVHVTGPIEYTAWYFIGSTGESTATVKVQSAYASGGPWFDEATSTALSSGACLVLRTTGPFEWVRPHVNTTGVTIRALGVGD